MKSNIPVYCINLKRATERRDYIENEWVKKRNIDIIFVDGYDMQHADMNNLPEPYRSNLENVDYTLREAIWPRRNMKLGPICCTISHCQLLERLIADNIEEAVILEDDAIPLFETREEFFNALEMCKEEMVNVDVLLLHEYSTASCRELKVKEEKNNYKVLNEGITCTQAIYYTRQGMLDALKDASKFIAPMDWTWDISICRRGALALINKPLTKHSSGGTTYLCQSGLRMFISGSKKDSLMKLFEKYQAPHISVYPFYNTQGLTLDQHFLRFYKNNIERFDKLKYVFIPVCWTDLYCKANYLELYEELQTLITKTLIHDELNNVQYFTLTQHDEGIKQQLPLGTVIFGAGSCGVNTVHIPLICNKTITDSLVFKSLEREYKKDIFCSFVGSITHPIRETVFKRYESNEAYKFHTKTWSQQCPLEKQKEFISITRRSKFTLCPRGYGVTSFRLYEAMQLGSVPVYIYDTPHLPFSDLIDWKKICVLIHTSQVDELDNILRSISDSDYNNMLNAINDACIKYFNIEYTFEYMLKYLEEPNKVIPVEADYTDTNISLTIITALHHKDKNIGITARSIIPYLNNNFKWIIKFSKNELSEELIELANIEHITVIGNEDKSLFDGLNQALAVTTTPYFLVLGSGDTICTDVLQQLKTSIKQKPQANSFYFAVRHRVSGEVILPNMFDQIKKVQPCCHQGAIMETQKALILGGFDTRYEIASDLDLIIKYTEKYKTFFTTDTIIAEFYGEGVSERNLIESVLENQLIRHRLLRGSSVVDINEIDLIINKFVSLKTFVESRQDRPFKGLDLTEPTKIYTVSSPTHDTFLPWLYTIKDVYPNIVIDVLYIDQLSESGAFYKNGWYEATLAKLEAITKILNNTDNSLFIFSDTDVQFFKPFHSIINTLLLTNDIVFQNDYDSLQCTGFFACRQTPLIKDLFNKALWLLKKRKNNVSDDQVAMHEALRRFPQIKHAMLPREFFTYGSFRKKETWSGIQQEFDIPENIIMHHANWTVGIQNKLDMLQYVKEKQRVQALKQQKKDTLDLLSKKICILTPPHCLFIAYQIKLNLRKFNIESKVSCSGYVNTCNEITSNEFGINDVIDNDNYNYIVICPQNFKVLPELYVSYQMEQKTSNWFTPNYLEILNNSHSILDYSTENIKYLTDKELHQQQFFYAPIGGIPNYKSFLEETGYKIGPQKEKYDVLFYGSICERRQKIINELSKSLHIHVESNCFGEELISKILNSKIVVNIHYYEDAILETTRIHEILSLGVPVVSEDSIDIDEHKDLSKVVKFVKSGCVGSLLQEISLLLNNESHYNNTAKSIKNYVTRSHHKASYYFLRYMLAWDWISCNDFCKHNEELQESTLTLIPESQNLLHSKIGEFKQGTKI